MGRARNIEDEISNRHVATLGSKRSFETTKLRDLSTENLGSVLRMSRYFTKRIRGFGSISK